MLKKSFIEFHTVNSFTKLNINVPQAKYQNGSQTGSAPDSKLRVINGAAFQWATCKVLLLNPALFTA